MFSASLYKEDNVSDFLFDFLHIQSLLERGLQYPIRKEMAPFWEPIFSL